MLKKLFQKKIILITLKHFDLVINWLKGTKKATCHSVHSSPKFFGRILMIRHTDVGNNTQLANYKI